MKQKIYIALAAIALLSAGCNAKVQKNEDTNTTEQGQQQADSTAAKEAGNVEQKQISDQTSQPHFSDGSDVEAVPTPEVKEIKMTADGFVPSTITIQKGDYIQFTNSDSNAHWPASDPHPTHTGLPGFDALKGITTGNYYRYQFTQTGTFGFHDHLHAALKGSVVVK
ncbi:MAG: cupredoxin domain-containing protein [Candidatus Doudnabacteria bacterium]